MAKLNCLPPEYVKELRKTLANDKIGNDLASMTTAKRKQFLRDNIIKTDKSFRAGHKQIKEIQTGKKIKGDVNIPSLEDIDLETVINDLNFQIEKSSSRLDSSLTKINNLKGEESVIFEKIDLFNVDKFNQDKVRNFTEARERIRRLELTKDSVLTKAETAQLKKDKVAIREFLNETDLTTQDKAKLTRINKELGDLEGSQVKFLNRQNKAIIRVLDREFTSVVGKPQKQTYQKINEINHILSNEEMNALVQDVLADRLGFGTTLNDLKLLNTLSKRSMEAEAFGREFYLNNKQFHDIKNAFIKHLTSDEKLTGKAFAGIKNTGENSYAGFNKIPEGPNKVILRNALEQDAELYASQVLRGERKLPNDLKISEKELEEMRQTLLEKGMQTQEFISFIGLKSLEMERQVYTFSKAKHAFKSGEIRQGIGQSFGLLGERIGNIADISRAILSSMDFSALLRQGFPVLLTSPREWAKGVGRIWGNTFHRSKDYRIMENQIDDLFTKTFSNVKIEKGVSFDSRKLVGDDDLADLYKRYRGHIDIKKNIVRAEIAMRPNALNGKYDIPRNGFGLRVTQEEAFPTSLPAKIPLLGRAFKNTEFSFEAHLLQWRANLADKFISESERRGLNWTASKSERDALGYFVSSMTGRGKSLGLEMAETSEELNKWLNRFFFAPRFIGSRFRVIEAGVKFAINGHGVSALEARMYAGLIASDISLLVGLHYLGRFLGYEGVDFNPGSANFGHLKLGNTSYDLTGGQGQLVSLLGRAWLARNGEKFNYKLGIYEDTGVFSQEVTEVLTEYFFNKKSPGARIITDIVNGHTWNGGEVFSLDYLTDTFMPITGSSIIKSVQNGNDISDTFMITLGELVGITSRDMAVRPTTGDWGDVFSAETGYREMFQRMMNDKPNLYGEAVKELNEEQKRIVVELSNDERFQKMETADQRKLMKKRLKTVSDNIGKKYARQIETKKED